MKGFGVLLQGSGALFCPMGCRLWAVGVELRVFRSLFFRASCFELSCVGSRGFRPWRSSLSNYFSA